MLNISRCTIIALLVSFCLICGCGSNNNSAATTNNFPVVVFSDVHFNPLYDPALYSQLVARDFSEWPAVFQSSNITTPPVWGNDTNYPLLQLALANIKQNLGKSPLIVFTGDMLGHGIPQQFYPQYYASLNLPVPVSPATPDATAVAAMKAFTDKTVSFFMDQVRSSAGNLPVLFAVGNIDAYANYGPNILDSSLNPDNSFLVNTIELYYTKFLNGTVDHQEFLTTFTAAGYYSAEPAGTNLMVIGLNTVIFSPSYQNATSGSTAEAELDWFNVKLASAKARGKKVWLLMHSPPGADIGTTTAKLATIANSNITTTAVMMWMPGYQTTFLNTVSNYPGLITQIFAGHTHMDEYRILTSSEVVEITPGITPWMGNNPAFKVYTFSGDTYKSIDYSSLNYDLAVNPARFNNYYTFSLAYSVPGLVNDSLTQLNPLLVTNYSKQSLYKGNYFSGHTYAVPSAYMSWPITYANWPVYWCGIGNMGQTEFINCVNSY